MFSVDGQLTMMYMMIFLPTLKVQCEVFSDV